MRFPHTAQQYQIWQSSVGLVVAFVPSLLLYLLDIGHLRLLDAQRVLYEVGK
jgi:hypothetical protein